MSDILWSGAVQSVAMHRPPTMTECAKEGHVDPAEGNRGK